MWKSGSPSLQGIEIKIFLSIYYFPLPDEGGENKIGQFLNFSVYFTKFCLRQGGLSFYRSHKGERRELTQV
mgnify:CR=1 FL=1